MLPWKHYLVNASAEIETLVLDFIQFEVFLCLTRFLPEQSLSLKCRTGRTQRADANGDSISLMKLKQNQTQILVVWVVTPSFFLQIINLTPVVFLLFCCLYSGQFIRQLPVFGGNNDMHSLLPLYETSCFRQKSESRFKWHQPHIYFFAVHTISALSAACHSSPLNWIMLSSLSGWSSPISLQTTKVWNDNRLLRRCRIPQDAPSWLETKSKGCWIISVGHIHVRLERQSWVCKITSLCININSLLISVGTSSLR